MSRPQLTVLLAILAATAVLAAEDTYHAELEKDRHDTDEMLRSARSPLLLIGRFKVNEGNSTIGSDTTCTIVLPPKSPAHVGTITRHGTAISFEPARGISVTLNDKPISTPTTVQVADPPKPIDHIGVGDLKIGVRPSGDDFILLLTDAQSPYLKKFDGTRWFAIDPAYRVTGSFVPSAQSKTLLVPFTDGGEKPYTVSGDLAFQLDRQTFHLLALKSVSGKGLFIMFQDQTSGKETYGGGRFLEVDAPHNGKTVLDFNKAGNPYCAYDPYAVCPMPLKENRIAIPIRAGEKQINH